MCVYIYIFFKNKFYQYFSVSEIRFQSSKGISPETRARPFFSISPPVAVRRLPPRAFLRPFSNHGISNSSPLIMAPKPKATPPKSHPYFKPGTIVEISSDDPGFRGSWYAGTVVRRASAKEPAKFLVEYTHLFDDEAGKKPLREIVDEFQLRPEPPRDGDRCFKFSEEVDAYYNDGWWEGVITEELGNERFSVFFRGSREQLEFGKEDLRLHREWVNGCWKPPLEEEEMEDAKAKEEEVMVVLLV